jgi:hypothetical protein
MDESAKTCEEYVCPMTSYLCYTGCNSCGKEQSCIIDGGCQASGYPPCANNYWICGIITAPIEIAFSPFTYLYHCINGSF